MQKVRERKNQFKGLSLVTITNQIYCTPPTSKSAIDQLLQEIKRRQVTDVSEWIKCFNIGGTKNKASELRNFQVVIIKKLLEVVPVTVLRKKIILIEDYKKEL